MKFQSEIILIFFLCLSIALQGFADVNISNNVTLESLQIFKTHDWFGSKPTVYFRCQGENKIYLPDVKDKNHAYAFKSQESWQPLTSFPDQKCKRCGFYEEDKVTTDDTFDEWELCPEDFSSSDGRYKHNKNKELNATFLCPKCSTYSSGDDSGLLNSAIGNKSSHRFILGVVIFCICVVMLSVAGTILYKLWQKKKREEQAARFLKLFEEDEDLESEFDLDDKL